MINFAVRFIEVKMNFATNEVKRFTNPDFQYTSMMISKQIDVQDKSTFLGNGAIKL